MSVIDYEVQTPAGPETRPVPVTIVNTEDLLTPYTPPSVVEQTSPETFAAQSWQLVAGTVQQILQQSPLRQSALISLAIEDSGSLSATINSPTTAITTPTAGQVLTSVVVPNAGFYNVTSFIELGGTTGSPADQDNFALQVNGSTVATSVNGSAINTAYPFPVENLNIPAGATVQLVAVGNATVGAVYRQSIELQAVTPQNNVRICHSLQSAQDVAKNGLNSGGGMVVTAPCAPFPVEATGGLWAVLETTGTVNVGVLSQERQR